LSAAKLGKKIRGKDGMITLLLSSPFLCHTRHKKERRRWMDKGREKGFGGERGPRNK